MSEITTTTGITSNVTEDGYVELALADRPIKPCKDDEVIIRVEAAPINPSDLGVMFGIADARRSKAAGTADAPILRCEIKESFRAMMIAALGGNPRPCGNEGAGVVVEAGSSPEAQALMGRTVAVMGGGMYATYRKAQAAQCIVFGEDIKPREAASSFVNPLTALSFLNTMRSENHKAIIHTAAASNLGQMLVKLCQDEDVPLINIVRKPEQVATLKALGASCVLNSSEPDFEASLVKACKEYEATLAFDAIGGGQIADQLLRAMEAALASRGVKMGGYGSSELKQVYVYGGLDRSPTTLSRGYGMSWSTSGYLMPIQLAKLEPAEVQKMYARVADNIRGIFASSYSKEVSLKGMLSQEAVDEYAQQATGLKYLVTPQA